MSHRDPVMRRLKNNEYQRAYYARNPLRAAAAVKTSQQRTREKLWQYKRQLSCTVCGENHPACLDFHHRDGTEKAGNIGELVTLRGWGFERILTETAKCEVLCANCHRKEHFNSAVEQSGQARLAHYQQVTGSNPVGATN